LFQVSAGMATVLPMGTLNRVMIVDLSIPASPIPASPIPASSIALMAALPILVAPFRALMGH
jgi:BCD family chlorophyll transporter-like MFS transporter